MSGMVVRQEAGGDEAAIRALHREAFGSDTEADLVDELRDEGSVVLSLVADDGGEIVGHVLYSRLIVDGAPSGVSSLAPMPSIRAGRKRASART
jgi:putative acetyltransferase